MIKSKIIKLIKPFKIEFENMELDKLQLKKGEILCETIYSAISPGTEISAYCGHPPLKPGNTYPRLVGYCNVAEVIETGPGKSVYEIGQKIYTFTSHRSHFITNEKDVLSVLPKNISPLEASCAYLFHLGYNAVLNTNVRYGSNVLVIGLGAIGLASIQMASNAGANVYALSDQSNSKSIAEKYGAIQVFQRKKINTLIKTDRNQFFDSVILTSSSWKDWLISLKLAAMRSQIGILGFPGRNSPIPDFNPLDSQYFYSKQLSLKAVGLSPEINDNQNNLKFNERDNMKFILSEIESGSINPNRIISEVVHYKKVESAYQNLINRNEEFSPITYVLKWKK